MRRQLIIEDLHVKATGKTILAGVCLTLHAGESLCLTGGNGAGKSTLLRAAAGLCGWSRGSRVFVGAGKVPLVTGVWQGNPGLMPKLSADRNYAYMARLFGQSGSGLRRRRDGLFERLGLAGHRSKPAGDLSTGLKMRLGLAMAFAAEADLLILDEVSNGLDEGGLDDLLGLVAEYRAAGGMILAATHDRRLMNALGARILTLQGGRPVPAPAAAADLCLRFACPIEDAA
jgi:ABC-type multidrug transport system ATPase subunit